MQERPMQRWPSVEELNSLRDSPVFGREGEKIGTLDTVYYDTDTGEAEWLGISSGLFGMSRALAPVAGCQITQEDGNAAIRLPFAKDEVKDAPSSSDDQLSEDFERQLYSHYGLQPSQFTRQTEVVEPATEPGYRAGPETTAPETVAGGPMTEPGMTGPGRETQADLTRHEEEMRVGKRDTVQGRARLRKWVETDRVAEDVDLRSEHARVEREPMNAAAPGAAIGEDEVEMTLHEEEPVVEKETVARERVSLEPEEETHRETVEGEVRREHIEAEGDVEDEGERWRKAS